MSNLVPFSDAGLPSAIVNRKRTLDVNKDIVTAAPYANLSIKGKVWTLVKDSERKIITKPDDPDETVQSLNLGFLRINMHSKTFYKKKFTEEDSEGQRPDCYSMDGVVPSANAPDAQAKKCAICPHNQWGSRVSEDNTGKGKACADHARIAVVDPTKIDKPLLLRVPPASLKPLKDALKMVKTRQLQYNEVVFRVGFDMEAASPKLTFKPVGVLDDASYEKACGMFEDEIVRAIVGADDDGAVAAPAPEQADDGADELDAALAAKNAVKAEAPPAPPPAPKPAAKPKKAEAPPPAPPPAPKPAPAPAPVASDGDDLLGDIDSLLSQIDD
jgi:hypothetical protein